MNPWICPRCGVVNAGWVARCTCRPATTVVSSGTVPQRNSPVCQCCGKFIDGSTGMHRVLTAMGIQWWCRACMEMLPAGIKRTPQGWEVIE